MTASQEPTRVTAGDTVSWTKSLSDYPASAGWVLSYTLINAANKYTFSAGANGADHSVSVSASTTAAWAASTYTWQAAVTKGAERYTVGTGRMVVAPNIAVASTLDTRSSARKALEAIDAILEQYGSKAYLHSFEINGRKQQFHSPSEFLRFRSRLQADVAREDNAARIRAGLAPKNQIAVRFNSR